MHQPKMLAATQAPAYQSATKPKDHIFMAILTVNLPDELHRALRARAAKLHSDLALRQPLLQQQPTLCAFLDAQA
ncbi:MAG: hypothetical protein RLZZ584_624 [Pseudomonadota bacterium]|jgi:hypothetical protein